MRRHPIIFGLILFLFLIVAFLLVNRLESSLYGLKFKIAEKDGTVKEGFSRKITLAILQDHKLPMLNNFEIHWTGFLFVPVTRLYPLQAGADDRLAVKIDGNVATIRDAASGHQKIQLFIPLQRGFHRLDADYWQFKGDYSLILMLNHSNRFLEWLDPPLYFPQIPSRAQLILARGISYVRNLMFAWIVLIPWLAIVAIVSHYSRRSVPSARQQKLWRIIKVGVPALIVLYAALLRFEALTIKHGVVTTPAFVRNLQQQARVLRYLHPDTVQWQPGSNPYEKGDPLNYLRMARAMKNFYAAQFREPFYVFWVKQSLRFFNNQDIAVSFASMTFSILAVLATFILAQYAFNFWVGVIASLCVAVDHELISIGVDGWRDDTFMFLVLMFCYASVRLFRKASFGNALFAGIIAGTVCLTRMTSLSFIVPGYLFVLLAGKDPSWKVRFKSVVLSSFIFAVLIAPFLINCAIVYGDPLFSVNDNTKFYRARENLAAKEPQSVAAYLTGRLMERPFRFIDIGFEGLTRYPFLNKWKGFNYLSPILSRFLAASALLGLILLLFSSRGRLILLILISSLIPYAFTYEIAGGYEWRFTMHAYPFYLIAGALFLTVFIGAFLTQNTWQLFSDRSLTKRSGLIVSLSLFVILVGGWFLLNESNFLRKQEAVMADEAILIESGKRDSKFFTSGWYRVVQGGGAPLRITNDTNAVISVPMKGTKEYNLIVRAYPVYEKPSNPLIVSVNVNSQPVGKLEMIEPAKSAYVLNLPKGVVKDGLNQIQFHRSDPDGSDIAVQYCKIQSLEAFQRAMEKYSNNELDEAIRLFEISLEQNKKRRAALYYLGMSYLKKSQPDKAIDYFTETISKSRGNTDALEARGYAYIQLKKYDAAIRDLTRVLKNEPDNENAQRLLSVARESARKP